MTAQLAHRTIAMEIVDRLREAILTAQLGPGALINQVELAATLGVSRGPIREALRQLEEEGLVTTFPYRGTFVVPITRRDVSELYSLRASLEEFAVGLFMEARTPEAVGELEETLREMGSAAASSPVPQVTNADLRFHTRIVERAGHRRLQRIWRQELTHIRRALSLLHHLDPDLETVEGNHRPILEAIRRGDAAEARWEIRRHCILAGEKLLARWPSDLEGEVTR